MGQFWCNVIYNHKGRLILRATPCELLSRLLKGVIGDFLGEHMGLTEGDTRSLDDSSCYLSNSGVHESDPKLH